MGLRREIFACLYTDSKQVERRFRPQKCPFLRTKVLVRAFPLRKAQGLQVRAVIHTGVPPQTLALREAIAQKPALLSLRDRLMAGEVPG